MRLLMDPRVLVGEANRAVVHYSEQRDLLISGKVGLWVFLSSFFSSFYSSWALSLFSLLFMDGHPLLSLNSWGRMF